MTMHQVQFMMIMLNGRLDRARRDERGVSAVEWVVISGLVVGICVAVAGVLMNRLSAKANNLDLNE